MMIIKCKLLVMIVSVIALCGCEEWEIPQFYYYEPTPTTVGSPTDIQPPGGQGPGYIEMLAQETIAKFVTPGMSEYEKAKAAFDYIIETSVLTEPIGLELWRIRGDDGAIPSFEENRSLSIFLFGLGMCEDYSAALTLLLRGMGMEARYVPGLTYAADGSGLVDHAWTVARIDGVWYHLDSQLEQKGARRDAIRYRYFMRSDANMILSHRWGRNLIDTGLLTQSQNEEIEANFLYAACPEDYQIPPPRAYTPAQTPDIEAIKAGIEAELRAYEQIHGPLAPLELNIIPPVFKLDGYGANRQ